MVIATLIQKVDELSLENAELKPVCPNTKPQKTATTVPFHRQKMKNDSNAGACANKPGASLVGKKEGKAIC